MEINPGIFKFDTGPFNWYLIKEAGRLTLVDAGFPGHYKTFCKGIESIGHRITDIEAIVLTHAHADHTGFAERVRKETGAPVYIHKADAAMAAKPLQLPWIGLFSNAWRKYTATMLGVAIVNGVFTLPRVTKTVSVNGGEVLDIPGKPRLLHTPGHTAGEMVLLMEDRKLLISGDTIVTRNLLTGALGEPQLTSPVLNSNYKEAMRSLDLLRELGNLTILPGHGTAWKGDVSTAVDIALQHAKRKG